MKKKLKLGIIIGIMMLSLTGCCVFHEWEDADCTNPKTCVKCEKTKGEALGHTLSEATCTLPQICSVCEEAVGEALGHTLSEATCIEASICSICGEKVGEALGHTWVEATCTEAKTCSVCGEIEGEALGHTWIEATCLNPKTCGRCNITEGELSDHNWMNATCQAPSTCSVCGLTEGETLEHQVSTDGICSLCNQQIGIPLTKDNLSDYLEWSYQDLTKEGAKTVYTGGSISGGANLEFVLSNAMIDGAQRMKFNYLENFCMELDVIIDYSDDNIEDECHTVTITQSDLDATEYTPYRKTLYYGLHPDAINIHKTVTGTIVNYQYRSRIEIKTVSGFVKVN